MIMPSNDFYPQSNPDSFLEIQDPQQEHSLLTSQGSTSFSVYSVSTNKAVDIPANLQSYRILNVKTHVTGSAKPDAKTYDSKNSSFNGAYFDKRATESTVSSKIAGLTQAQNNLSNQESLSNQSEILPNISLSKTHPIRLPSPPNTYLSYQDTALGYTPSQLNNAPSFDGGFQSLRKTEIAQASSSSILDLQQLAAGQKQNNYNYLTYPSTSVFPKKVTTPTTTTVPSYIPLTQVKSRSFQELKKHSARQLQSLEMQIPSKTGELSEQSFLEEDIKMCNLI